MAVDYILFCVINGQTIKKILVFCEANNFPERVGLENANFEKLTLG